MKPSCFRVNFLLKLTRRTSEASFFKRSPEGVPYSFGGINVTLVGDMYQLDPPDNSFPLYSIPHNLVSATANAKKHPLVTHALEIIWGQGEQSINGMTELDEPYRCRDPWWNQAGENKGSDRWGGRTNNRRK